MKPPIKYTVDDEEQTTTEDRLTATQILSNAGIDATQHYLILVHSHQHQVSYQDKMSDEIHLHPKMKFISAFTGSTPVS